MKKKLFSVLLTAIMAFSVLTGCGKSTTTEETKDVSAETATEMGSEATEAAEQVANEGEGKKVTALFFSLEGEYFKVFDAKLQEELEAKSYTYESQSSNMDAVTMIEQIENAVANGTDALWIWALSGASVADACRAALDQGVIVYTFIQDPGEDARTVFRGSDETECGTSIAELAIDWANKESYADAGSIKTVIMGNTDSAEQKERFEAVQEKITTDKRFEVVEAIAIEANTVKAQEAAENMYSKYGDIDCFICCGGEMSLGTIAYVTSESSPVEDPTKVGIFGTEISEEQASSMRDGVYKGTIINGGNPMDNIKTQSEELNKLLKGEEVYSFSPVDMGKATIDNLSEFGY